MTVKLQPNSGSATSVNIHTTVDLLGLMTISLYTVLVAWEALVYQFTCCVVQFDCLHLMIIPVSVKIAIKLKDI